VVRKRDIRDEERALWDEVMRDVRRMRGAKSVKPAAEKKRAARAAVAPALPAPAPTPKAAPPVAKPRKQPMGFGVDGATAERLKRGKVEPDATIDLHGMTQAQAHSRLVSFVRRAHEHEYRCVLVVTGKGSPVAQRDDGVGFVMPERSKAGVLKTMVPRWLEEDGLRALVVGVQGAHQRHGGAGALYVYLRRKRSR
jgi:DNA-nicking Smr family endonuclease